MKKRVEEIPVQGPVTARLKVGGKLEKLSKKELIAIIEAIRPDAGLPIWASETEGGNPLWGNKEGIVIGYMDKVDFDYELGGASGGNKVYPSISNLEFCQPCTKSCGVVEVEIRLRRVIRESNFEVGGRLAKDMPKPTKQQQQKQKKKIKERQELHLTAAQLGKLPPKKVQEILERARKEK